MKKLILILIFSVSSFALSIDNSLLKVHATLVPKLYLMDYKFKEKIANKTIKINIFYTSNEYLKAKELKSLMTHRYKNGLKGYKLDVKLVKYSALNKPKANIYYLFPSVTKDIKNVVQEAKLYNALTFSYQNEALKYGVMISLNISKKLKPLLNLKAIQTNNIVFRPVLIDISAIYNKDFGSNLKYLNIKNLLIKNVYKV